MRGAQRKGNIYISLSQTGMLTGFQRHRLPCCFPTTSFKSAVGQREKTGSWFLGRGAQWTELHPLGGRWGQGALLIPLLTSSLIVGVFQISTRPPCLDQLKRWRQGRPHSPVFTFSSPTWGCRPNSGSLPSIPACFHVADPS